MTKNSEDGDIIEYRYIPSITPTQIGNYWPYNPWNECDCNRCPHCGKRRRRQDWIPYLTPFSPY